MAFRRSSIEHFALANPVYAGATVTFYQADSNGNQTATTATLYANYVGATTLVNPQELDSDGRFQQPVYHDVAIIGVVSGLSIASHATGVVFPSLDDAGVANAEAAALAAETAAQVAMRAGLQTHPGFNPIEAQVFGS